MEITPTLMTDGYKIDHRSQYNPGTVRVLSNMTPRTSRIDGISEIVVVGINVYLKKTLKEHWDTNFFYKPWEAIENEFKEEMLEYTLSQQAVDHIGIQHWRDLYDLGYLPLEIRALKEGTLCPIKVPMYTINETDKRFFWLVNFIETDMSSEFWGFPTAATIAYQYKKILTKAAIESGGDLNFVPFQGHNFSYRGMLGREAAWIVDIGHLTSFVGSDTIPGRVAAKKYYNARQSDGIISCSVFATEHAVMCTSTGFYILKNNLTWERYGEAEYEVFKRLITEVYPTGIVSIVSDTWDLWKVILTYLVRLKEIILARDGKVVIRPDSGDPVDILCGQDIDDISQLTYVTSLEIAKQVMKDRLVEEVGNETEHGQPGDSNPSKVYKYENKYYKIELDIDWNRYDKQFYYMDGETISSFQEVPASPEMIGVVELLYKVFGGSETEIGTKVLHPNIGCIYGDSITLDRATRICERLLLKGFASTNWVAGIGSYSYQYVTRDTFGFAQKSTYAEIELEEGGERHGIEIFKNPITDNGTKKSAKGITVVKKDENNRYYLKDQATWDEFISDDNELKLVWQNGVLLVDYTLQEIRNTLASYPI